MNKVDDSQEVDLILSLDTPERAFFYLTVALEEYLKDDHAAALMKALEQIDGAQGTKLRQAVQNFAKHYASFAVSRAVEENNLQPMPK